MKKAPIITFITSAIVCAASAVAPYYLFNCNYPLEIMLKVPYHGMFYYIFTVSASLVVASLLALIFRNTIKENCTFETSLISIGLSTATGFGAYSIVSWAFCKFSSTSHSVRYPASIALGIVSLLAFLILLVTYIFKRSKKLSLQGIIADIVTALIFAFPFYIILSAGVTLVLYLIHLK